MRAAVLRLIEVAVGTTFSIMELHAVGVRMRLQAGMKAMRSPKNKNALKRKRTEMVGYPDSLAACRLSTCILRDAVVTPS